ncbi:MAG: polyketide cyclase [Rhizobacter sp.]|nr:polyketide cyclase [Rhizobacter sp.]
MSNTDYAPATPPATEHVLTLTRLIDVPRDKLYRCWTEPALIVQWFTPPPWKTVQAVVDVRAGGTSLITMEGPDGMRMANPGVYLEVVPNERLVFTDAFTSAWIPSAKAFMVGILTFEDEGGKTRYTATVRHWSAEDKAMHEQMGFDAGWGIATDQLAKLAATL